LIWVLGITGILLALLGLWGGPAKTASKRRDAEALARKQPTVSDAWDVLSRPLEEELIKIPEHRPWYTPGRDHRFQQGLLLGLGAGLMAASIVVSVMPRPAAQAPQMAAKEPAATAPAPAPAASGGATAAAPTPAPAQQAPKPVNVSFVVNEGDTADVIADNLKAKGLIADPAAFLQKITELGVDTSLKAGTFVIPTNAPLETVIGALTTG
jgi:hypothetical protein